jgi:hypothetical protein
VQRHQVDSADTDVLAEWIRGTQPGTRVRTRRRIVVDGGLRFAFYGRISTEDFQDRVSSSVWQRVFAADVIAGHGTIVAEFFDVGYSRRRDWPDRPQAAALLAEMVTPVRRRFDAIVVGSLSGRSTATTTRGWLRCSTGTGSRSGCPKSTADQHRRPDPHRTDDAVGCPVEAGSAALPLPGDGRNVGPGQSAGPPPRRAPALRVPAGSRSGGRTGPIGTSPCFRMSKPAPGTENAPLVGSQAVMQ